MFNIRREKHDYICIVIAIGFAIVFAELVYLLAGSVIGLAADLLNYNGVWVFVGSIICTIILCVGIVASILSE